MKASIRTLALFSAVCAICGAATYLARAAKVAGSAEITGSAEVADAPDHEAEHARDAVASAASAAVRARGVDRAPSRSRAREDAREEEEREEDARVAIEKRIDDAAGLDARLDELLVATLGSSASIPEAMQRGPLMEYFLRRESVQAELRARSDADRAEALAHLRRRLGCAEEEIVRLRLRDTRQAALWDQGRAYMHARGALAARLSGEAFENRAAELRRTYFGERAETIRREEESGFFRFERPQILGRN